MFRTEFINLVLGHSPFQSVPRHRRRVYATLALLTAALLVLAIGIKVGGWASHTPGDATDPLYIQATASQVASVRQWWVFRLCAIDFGLSYLSLSLLLRTPLGKVLLWWSMNHDTAESQGAKTSNAGRIFCAFLIGYAILLAQVLP